jgi:uncharacterized repeat protein (TIGR01451 family)
MNVGLLTLALAVGQPVAPAVPPPALPPAPFLFVTVAAPEGTQVTWHPAGKEETVTAGPVGLRPGYPYRVQLSDIPGARGVVLHPSIEVRGALVPRPGLDVSKHPVPIAFTADDIDHALQGRMVTKFYYLEDPETAVPIEGAAGQALEFTAENEDEAIRAARLRGRPMLIVRLGERPATKEELTFENVPGTILFPGATRMPIPAVPPRLPFSGIIVYDPIIGARGASEECIKDGGDVGPRAAPGPGGPTSIGGVDPTDTVMQYSTRSGTRTEASNRVCICVPRFGAMRVEAGAIGYHYFHSPQALTLITPPMVIGFKVFPGGVHGFEQARAIYGHQRASGIIGITGPAALDLWSGRPAGLSSISGVAVIAEARGPEEITAFPGCKSLMIQKTIDPPNPERIGQEVTVHLRFSNPTTEEMTDVVVADSLSARLEYVVGSSKTSRPATFAATPNAAGSQVLRWAIDGVLKPGESGSITFKVRIK